MKETFDRWQLFLVFNADLLELVEVNVHNFAFLHIIVCLAVWLTHIAELAKNKK